MAQLAWTHLSASLYAERAAPPEEGIDAWLRGAAGDIPQRLARGIVWHRAIARRAEALEPVVASLSDRELRERLRRAARERRATLRGWDATAFVVAGVLADVAHPLAEATR